MFWYIAEAIIGSHRVEICFYEWSILIISVSPGWIGLIFCPYVRLDETSKSTKGYVLTIYSCGLVTILLNFQSQGSYWKCYPWINLITIKLLWKFQLKHITFSGDIRCPRKLMFWHLPVRYDSLSDTQCLEKELCVSAEISRAIWWWWDLFMGNIIKSKIRHWSPSLITFLRLKMQ
jgi:hypothetical protein